MTQFTYICLHVLLDHHRAGIEEAHPNYIEEKLQAFENGNDENAWCALDYRNKGRVLTWCKRWNVPTDPRFQENYDKETNALAHDASMKLTIQPDEPLRGKWKHPPESEPKSDCCPKCGLKRLNVSKDRLYIECEGGEYTIAHGKNAHILPPQPASEGKKWESILGAIAREWTHEENRHISSVTQSSYPYSHDMTPFDEQNLLDKFAMAALTGMIANNTAQKLFDGGIGWGEIGPEIARQAYDYASAMVAERKRRMEK